eukprot:1195470-Prorocentrum_minimum.AAC.4
MATWLSALIAARFFSARAARVFPSASPVLSSCTSGSTAPARCSAQTLPKPFSLRPQCAAAAPAAPLPPHAR